MSTYGSAERKRLLAKQRAEYDADMKSNTKPTDELPVRLQSTERDVTTYMVAVEHIKGEMPILSVSEGARILSVGFAHPSVIPPGNPDSHEWLGMDR